MASKNPVYYDSFPLWMVLTIILLQLLVTVSGVYIMWRLSCITGVLYLLFTFFMEYNIYKKSCPACCYYGKRCAFGKGYISAWFFKRGDAKYFKKKIGWKDFAPLIAAVAIPILVGIALLISRGWSALTLAGVIYLLLSWFAVNPLVYGKLACAHCKQGKKCCPALDFFKKKK